VEAVPKPIKHKRASPQHSTSNDISTELIELEKEKIYVLLEIAGHLGDIKTIMARKEDKNQMAD